MLEKLPSIHTAARVSIVERAIQRSMQLRALFRTEVVVDDYDFHLRALRQVGRLVYFQTAVSDLNLQRVHVEAIVTDLGYQTSRSRCGPVA